MGKIQKGIKTRHDKDFQRMVMKGLSETVTFERRAEWLEEQKEELMKVFQAEGIVNVKTLGHK